MQPHSGSSETYVTCRLSTGRALRPIGRLKYLRLSDARDTRQNRRCEKSQSGSAHRPRLDVYWTMTCSRPPDVRRRAIRTPTTDKRLESLHIQLDKLGWWQR